MSAYDIKNELTTTTLLPAADVTATGNGTGVDISGFVGTPEIIFDSGLGTGTTPTLDVKLQDSADNSTFADITGKVFTQVTGAAGNGQQTMSFDTRSTRRYIRLVKTVAGTTPSFPCSAALVGRKNRI